MKLGLCTGTYADLPLEEVCRLAAEYGYETLEIETFEKDNLHLDPHTILEKDNIKRKLKITGWRFLRWGIIRRVS